MLSIVLLYIGLFFSIFFEGELVLISAVIAARHGHLNLWWVVVIAILATISADIFYFTLGRTKAKGFIERSKLRMKFQQLEEQFNDHRKTLLLSYRFLYGLRTVTPIFLGTQSLSVQEFMSYSIGGTLLWCTLITGLGIIFGDLMLTYLKDVEKIEFYFIGALLLLAGILTFRRWQGRMKAPSEPSSKKKP